MHFLAIDMHHSDFLYLTYTQGFPQFWGPFCLYFFVTSPFRKTGRILCSGGSRVGALEVAYRGTPKRYKKGEKHHMHALECAT